MRLTRFDLPVLESADAWIPERIEDTFSGVDDDGLEEGHGNAGCSPPPKGEAILRLF